MAGRGRFGSAGIGLTATSTFVLVALSGVSPPTEAAATPHRTQLDGAPAGDPASGDECEIGLPPFVESAPGERPGDIVTMTLPPGCYRAPAPFVVPHAPPAIRVRGDGTTLTGDGSIFEVPSGARLVVEELVISDSGDSAIRNYGTLSVKGTTFSGNKSRRDGGAIDSHGGTVTVRGSTFTGNTSARKFAGGAIAIDGGTARVTNSTFSKNGSGADGGAIDNTNGTLTVTNSTFLYNTSSGHGGAIGIDRNADVRNSIFLGNKGDRGEALASFGNGGDVAHSIIAASGPGGCFGFDGVDNLSDVPRSGCGDAEIEEGLGRIGPLADNDGTTRTAALLTGNPAIDGGDNAYCSEPRQPEVDQRGVPRPHSAANPCDIGAYEANRVTVGDVLTREGSRGCTRIDFTVELDAPQRDAVHVTPSVSGASGACDSGGFAVRRLDRVTIAPGDDSATVTTGARADAAFAPSRHVFLRIVDAVNAVIADESRRATATIVNDDRNNAPVARDHAAAIPAGDSLVAVDLSGLVDDAETPVARLAYELAGDGPQAGAVTLAGPLATYELRDVTAGDDAFTYRVTDAGDPACGVERCEPARSATGTISITIPAPSPTAAPDPLPTSPAPPETATPSASGSPPAPGPSPSPPVPPPGVGPDLSLEDMALELVRGASAAGPADGGVYALGPGPAVLAVSEDSLRLTTTVANRGAGDSAPTSITVASPGWAGGPFPVPAVPAGAAVGVDESMPAPSGVTRDTRFVVTIGVVEGEVDATDNVEPNVVAAIAGGDGSSGVLRTVALLFAVALVGGLAVAATTLLRGRSSIRSSQPSKDERQGGRARVEGLNDLADRYLGADPGPPLAFAGPASQRLREALRDDERATPLIATLYWRAFLGSPGFAQRVAALGASAGAIEQPDVLVVTHAGGTRHDLVVLDPEFSQPEPSGSSIEVPPEELARAWQSLAARAPDGFRGAVGEWSTSLLMQVVAEAARFGRFGVVLARKPDVVLTQCPSPAWPVGTGEDAATSSAGAVAVDTSGRKGVTVADHAIRGHEKVMVNGCLGTVVSSDAISDSSFVEVDLGDGLRADKGPLTGVSPRQMEVVEFDGIRSGRTTTRVVGWDPTILTMDSYIQSKIVTEPVTVQGDSGAALVDGEGHILGFAFYTTGLNAHPAHSGWIWAASVYRAHGLSPCRGA
ncbi:MAG: Ig-like domain-containing protein [Actinomycetota bacterium]|nr:Ig-like domain-containing protein [Actinomycetota bacterium]